jgi:hypothetical protein
MVDTDLILLISVEFKVVYYLPFQIMNLAFIYGHYLRMDAQYFDIIL